MDALPLSLEDLLESCVALWPPPVADYRQNINHFGMYLERQSYKDFNGITYLIIYI